MEKKKIEKVKNRVIVFPAKTEILGIIVAATPLFITINTSYTENGRIVSYTDYAAIIGGILALIIGIINYRLLPYTTDDDLLKRRITFLGVIGMGAFQLLRGLGLFI